MKKKKSGKTIFNDYRSLRDDIVSDMIREAFDKNPSHPYAELEKMGFQWMDDEYGEDEFSEEERAVPENTNQEFLIAYFEGHVKWSEAVAEAYNTEKNADSPNYPLLRRYYRKGNPALKILLLKGLDTNPTDASLLHDLSFFHDHHGMLAELITRYSRACQVETDLMAFSELAMDFYYNTIEDGFEAFHELKQIVKDSPRKSETLDRLISEHDAREKLPNDIPF